MGRSAVLGRPTDPPDQRIQLCVNLRQLPFDGNRLFVVALFRVLCHHERASLPGNTWLLTPIMAQEAFFLIPNLPQAPQTNAPALRTAGHTLVKKRGMAGYVPFFNAVKRPSELYSSIPAIAALSKVATKP